jgi:hypothetical protein
MSSLLEIAAETVQYVRVAVSATKAGVAYNPTSCVVSFAFVPVEFGETTNGATWHTGSWDTVSGVYYAMVLVGDGWSLAPDTYAVFVRIVDSPETPVMHAGYLRVR